jgi:hypothetical protein
MRTEKAQVTATLVVFCALGCLSAISPIVNVVMTILLVGALLVAGITAVRYLGRLNRPTDIPVGEPDPPGFVARR